MATLVLTAAGSVFGPIGGAIGAVVGRTIDGQLFKPGSKEGPRLKELSVSASSYGTPIAGQYGATRSAGTIFWSTDLQENSSIQGGGKGKPESTSYSYSVSLAIALSSLPIDGVGRIWADGNLLRGSAGDLKSGGTLRIHKGHGDQDKDPLLEAVLGSKCPAHRGLAYVVFEDLDLTDFGNRIPALSFEVFAGEGGRFLWQLLRDSAAEVDGDTEFPELLGFSHEQGSYRDIISLVDRLKPIHPVIGDATFEIRSSAISEAQIPKLPAPSAWDDAEFAPRSGNASARQDTRQAGFSALRYYDANRDYQPGLQQTDASQSDWNVFEFPGVMAAEKAKQVAITANRLSGFMAETLAYRIAELDPKIAPGTIVSVPGRSGLWLVTSWEWRERGVELQLARYRSGAAGAQPADSGDPWRPLDRLGAETSLRVFELPWDGTGSASERVAFAAIGASSGRWSGARLFTQIAGGLDDTGLSATRRAANGKLHTPLPPSSGLRFESASQCEVVLEDAAQRLRDTDIEGIASGANRILIGTEIIQFLSSVSLGGGRWRLTGLLRGRGGTELDASAGHQPGSDVTLLDDKLIRLTSAVLSAAGSTFYAFGITDDQPARAQIEGANASLRPLSPVHGISGTDAFGSVELEWTRRARGGWTWLDEVEQPLVEQTEAYEVGLGPEQSPYVIWTTGQPRYAIPAEEVDDLRLQFPEEPIWVRQCGSHAKSRALRLRDAL
ncbi:GTA baseplate fiber-binding domain-containing protein [Qipengyuania seohaensis]|uniref:GTA baseplate fiber-binding domain-containing protein n=1 Tax=Qipengyuania seohaensis TaxID=266951 RepID=UPI000C22D85A|nr:phage tail protein [Qipengyuania seohaensis]